MVGTWQDPFRRREVWYDSGLEAKLLLVLIAAPDVVEIREQQRADFVLGGKKRHHFFDCVVRWTDNWRSACAIKYEKDVTPELEDDLDAIADQRGDAFADDVRILTEKYTDIAGIKNAARIVQCGLDYDEEAKEFVLGELARLDEMVCLRNLDHLGGDGARASRAAIALIQRGVLAVRPGDVIGPDTLLCNRFTS